MKTQLLFLVPLLSILFGCKEPVVKHKPVLQPAGAYPPHTGTGSTMPRANRQVFKQPTVRLNPKGYEKVLVFKDDFNRREFGPKWYYHGGNWRIVNGEVHSTQAKNKCLWGSFSLPENSLISLEARSMSQRGDIKFGIYGDGIALYSGYVIILGGWWNKLSVISRFDEHGPDRVTRAHPGAVTPRRKHHLVVRRLHGRIDWFVDGVPYMSYTDRQPLFGKKNDRFNFCNWAAPLFFDNLRVYALKKR